MGLLQMSKTTISTTGERLEQVIELLLISLLAFMPFAFGAVEAWSEERAGRDRTSHCWRLFNHRRDWRYG
jgi:hypothetical protein